eukprot:TRINITY_DN7157_c0_g1_i2.p1 TRINITY_DN7157_c0_g1~~TRINITY_DN7157_c0_g1_i2.p1  ORF type:complete len:222 (-),score=8.85 TRINITY_DN7157_c0_g1_i2:281-946(-)
MGNFFTRHSYIAFYLPNLIGYGRLICTMVSLWMAFSQPILASIIYFIGFGLDAVDGLAARKLNQTSTMGILLDMTTDRLSTTGLLCVLCIAYQRYYMVFISLIFIDIASHWTQMYATLLLGKTSHKDSADQGWLMNLYYHNRIFMGYCCVACEVVYLALLIMCDVNSAKNVRNVGPGLDIALYAFLPGFIIKQVVNVLQLLTSVDALNKYDLSKNNQVKKE